MKDYTYVINLIIYVINHVVKKDVKIFVNYKLTIKMNNIIANRNIIVNNNALYKVVNLNAI